MESETFCEFGEVCFLVLVLKVYEMFWGVEAVCLLSFWKTCSSNEGYFRKETRNPNTQSFTQAAGHMEALRTCLDLKADPNAEDAARQRKVY